MFRSLKKKSNLFIKLKWYQLKNFVLIVASICKFFWKNYNLPP